MASVPASATKPARSLAFGAARKSRTAALLEMVRHPIATARELVAAAAAAPVRVQIFLFTLVALLECATVYLEVSTPPILFSGLCVLDYSLRLQRAGLPDSELWWPVGKTILAALAIEKFQHRPRGTLMKRIVGKVKAQFLGDLIHNPIKTMKFVRRVLAYLRWVKWGLPLIRMGNQTKNAAARLWQARKKKREHDREMALFEKVHSQGASHRISADLPERVKLDMAATRLQSAWRAKVARGHVATQRRSAQLRAKWAAKRFLRIVEKKRESWQAKADLRPFLLRPDSSALSVWKLVVLATVLIDVSQTLLASDGEKLTKAELVMTLGLPECLPGPPVRPVYLIGRKRYPPLPHHCHEVDFDHTWLGILASVLSTAVGVIATADVFIEYFTGSISPTTGTLDPKSFADRYVRPPYSLGFSILTNPAVGSIKTFLSHFIDISRPVRTFRLIVFLQPLLSHLEGWVCRALRRMMRSAAFSPFFSRQGPVDGVGDSVMLATMAAGLWAA